MTQKPCLTTGFVLKPPVELGHKAAPAGNRGLTRSSGTSREGLAVEPTQNNRQHALYRFFDSSDRLLYVGITIDPGARWKTHSKDQPWWSEVANCTIEQWPSREMVLRAERAAIIGEHPKHNVVHNNGNQAAARPLDVLERMTEWPGWGVEADDMPDDCHDDCGKAGFSNIYYPYRWGKGLARYRCARGHHWTCGWGHNYSGDAPENSGKRQSEEIDFRHFRGSFEVGR